MLSFNLVGWLKTWFRARVKTIVKRPRLRLRLEELETRLAPATFIWTGAGTTSNWSMATNWQGSIAPKASDGLDDLIFDNRGAVNLSPVDDISGLNLDSITIDTVSGYSISALPGVAVTLGNPQVSGSGFINVQAGVSPETIALPIQFAGAGASQQFITVGSSSTLTLSGQLSGTTGSQLTKEGTGELILTGNNNAYVGPFTIDHDAGIVQVSNNNALGGLNTMTVETLTLNNATPTTKFTLKYGVGAGSTTPAIAYTGTAADASTVQTALNALANINGAGGSVQVYQTNTASSESFTITFTGTFTGTDVLTQVLGTVTTAPGSFSLPTVTAGGAASPYGVTVGNNSQLQVNGGITVANPLQLTGTGIANDGALNNFAGINTWSGNVTLDSTAVDIGGAAGTLTISGAIGDAVVANLTKVGAASLALDADNTYRGSTTDENGPLIAENPFAFGSVPSAGVYVDWNSVTLDQGSLQIAYIGGAAAPTNPTGFILQNSAQVYSAGNPYVGFTVPNDLFLDCGAGFGGLGAFTNSEGDNVWSGPVAFGNYSGIFGTNIDINVNTFPLVAGVPTTLTITGVISDTAARTTLNPIEEFGGGDLILEPTIPGTDIGTPNTYHDQTEIFGTITLEDSQGLGLASKSNVAGFTTVEAPNGALDLASNVGGNLAIAGFVQQGHIDSVTGTTNRLNVSGTLTLNGTGVAGTGALRSVSGINTYSPAVVSQAVTGATDATPIVVTIPNNGLATGMDVTITGVGGNTATNGTWTVTVLTANTFSLDNSIGNGIYTSGGAASTQLAADITVGNNASIGVDAEPVETPNANYLADDYSLTITGGLKNSVVAGVFQTIIKDGAGNLILPNANPSLAGDVDVKSGWITMEDDEALGPTANGTQPTDTVESGAALMILPFAAGSSFVGFIHNLTLQGVGITHPYAVIDQQGALENLGGVNDMGGFVHLIGQAGIGVNQINPNVPSALSFGSEVFEVNPAAVTVLPQILATGGVTQYSQVIDTGATSGSISIAYTGASGTDNFQVYDGPLGAPGSTLLANVTPPAGAGVLALPGGGAYPGSAPGIGTNIEVVVDNGVVPAGGANWTYTVTVTPTVGDEHGGIVKLGTGILALDGIGLYTGGVDIKQGVVAVFNDNALGSSTSNFGVTVEAGAALELHPSTNGGGGDTPDTVGPTIVGIPLSLNGTGNSTFGDAPLTVEGGGDNEGSDSEWTGNITLNTNVAITFQGALANQPVATMTANYLDASFNPTLNDPGSVDPTVDAATTTAGGNGLNAVQMLTFGGLITDVAPNTAYFTLSYNGATSPHILWSLDPNILVANIQTALQTFFPPVAGVPSFAVSLTSPTINVAPDTRLVVSGVISDGGTVAGTPSPLTHQYILSGASASLADTMGGPSLVSVGGALTPAGYTFAGLPAAAGANQGLQLSGALPTPAGNNYSIQMDFDFSTTPAVWNGTGYARVIDFKNRTSDNGLYFLSNSGTVPTTSLDFYNGGPNNGPNGVYAPGVSLDLIITRSAATGIFTAYVNGVQEIQFDDATTGNNAVFSGPGNIINFFLDDLPGFPDEVSAGTVTKIQIYSVPLTQAQVTTVVGGGTLGTPGFSTSTYPADLIVAGGGALLMAGANTYRGTTYVDSGSVTLQNNQALGGPGIAGKQEIALNDPVPFSTQFNLSFGGVTTTTPITYTGTATDAGAIQSALQGLSSIGAGNVLVTQEAPGIFLATFYGSLANTLKPFSASITSAAGSGTIDVIEFGGTVVADNAQLQLEGGITVGGEPLVIQGAGDNAESEVDQFTVSTSASPPTVPTGTYTLTYGFDGDTTAPLPFDANADQIQTALQTLLDTTSNPDYTPGAQVSVNQISTTSGNAEIQYIEFVGMTAGTSTYQFYFDPSGGPAVVGINETPVLTYAGNPATDENNALAALNALPTISGAAVEGIVLNDGRGSGGAFPNNFEYFYFYFDGGLASSTQQVVTVPFESGTGFAFGGEEEAGSAGTQTFQVVFQGSLAGQGQFLSLGTTTGTTTVSGPSSVIFGGSSNVTPTEWIPIGPDPVVGGALYTSDVSDELGDVVGPVTGIAVNPKNANYIYVSTAGGGLWWTQDGGETWSPLYDNLSFFNETTGTDDPAPSFGGSIFVDANQNVYYGTGVGDYTSDSYYGSGVYENGQLLVNSADGSNPLAGMAVDSITVGGGFLYAAVSDADSATPNSSNDVNGRVGTPADGAGIWRYNLNKGIWFNMTASDPSLPTTDGQYKDVFLDSAGNLWLDLSTQNLPPGPGFHANPDNGVYECVVGVNGPTSALPAWSAEQLGPNFFVGVLGAAVPATGLGTVEMSGAPGGIVYFTIANSPQGGEGINAVAEFNPVGGWSALTTPSEYLATQADYADAFAVSSVNPLVMAVGGIDQGAGNPNFVQISLNGGTSWTGIALPSMPGPETAIHAIAFDNSANVFDVASDGGVWSYNIATSTWTDLNTNNPLAGPTDSISDAELDSVAVNPNNLSDILASGHGIGVAQQAINSAGLPTWTQEAGGNSNVDLNFNGGNSDGGEVEFVPNDPIPVAYAFNAGTGDLDVSMDGGATWANTGLTGAPTHQASVPFALDPNNPQRIVAALGFTVFESTNTGAAFIGLGPTPAGLGTITSLAISDFQGTYQADPAFPGLTALAANQYDASTIYITDGTNLYVTKNLGNTWSPDRNSFITLGNTITDIVVDPADRDTVYAVVSGPVGATGTGVYKSTNAGVSWNLVGAGLPDIPLWTLALDPRTNDLYVGTDMGVYMLAGGIGTWTQFGNGLPNVQVKDLSLDTNNNILTAATYGRGAWQFQLATTAADQGVLQALGGSDIWNGPVTLDGPTTISASGSQALQGTVAGAKLTILGTISDQITGSTANTLTKIGGGDVALGGANTYAGLTDVQQGNLIVQNPSAFGATTLGTIVESGAALELASSLGNEPITLNGNGILPPYNGHYTGALVNSSNFNTYTGTLTLNTNSTIGVQAGQLTIAGSITDGGNDFSLDKEGGAELALAGADSYQGGTTVSTGILNVQNASALGTGTTTTVGDTAQLQLQAPAGTSLTIPASQTLLLTGTGITDDGALKNVAGNNTWAGPIGLTAVPSFSTASSPEGVVAIYVDAGNSLTLPGVISEVAPVQPAGLPATNAPASGLADIGAGTLILAGNNTYTGGTYIGYNFGTVNTNGASAASVPGGVVDVQNSGALGTDAGNEIQRISTFDPPGANDKFTLSFGGQTTGNLAYGLPASGGAGPTASVQNALNALSTVGAGGVTVTGTTVYSGLDETQTLTLTNPVAVTGAAPVQNPLSLMADPASTIPSGTTYFYVITAFTLSGESLPSNEESITTTAAGQEINLSWSTVPGAYAYNVYRSTTSGNYASPSGLEIGYFTTLTNIMDDGTSALFFISPPVQTQFTLAYNGVPTAPIAYSGVGATDAAAIAAALNTAGILPAGGTVSVSADPTDTIFTITFGGTLSDTSENLLGATITQTSAGATVSEATPGDGGASYLYTVHFTGAAFQGQAEPLITIPPTATALVDGVSEVATGGIGTLVYTNSALQLDGDPNETGAPPIQLPAANVLALNGNGPTGAGAFVNTTGDNTWQGNVILQSSSTIAANPTTQLTITGLVQDPTLPAASSIPMSVPPNLTKAGTGAVILAPAKQTITLTNPESLLGAPFQPAAPTQAFNALATIPFGTTYYYVITALGANGESVQSNEQSVTSFGFEEEIVVGWNAVAGATGGYKIYRSLVSGSYGPASLLATVPAGTVSYDDLGNATVAGSPPVQMQFKLTYDGATTNAISYTGAALADANAIRNQLGLLAPIAGGGGAVAVSANPADTAFTVTITGLGPLDTAPISGAVTASASSSIAVSTNTYTGSTFVSAGDLNIQSAQALGFNTSSVQEVSVSGSSGSFDLTFMGQVTAALQYGSTATQVAAALNALSTIGTNGVTVTQVGNNYYVYFNGGTLAHVAQPAITGAIVTAGVSVPIVTPILPGGNSSTTVTSGATLQTQSAGTGFTEDSGKPLTINGAGFNNAGALENVSGNNTWGPSTLTMASPSSIGSDNTASTLFITTPIVGPGFGVTKVGAGIVQFASLTGNNFNGLTDVHAGTLQLNDTGSGLAVPKNLQVGDGAPVGEVEELKLGGFNLDDSFTLTYNSSPVSTPITYYTNTAYEASLIQTALDSLATIGGLASPASVSVVPDAITPNAYDITFGGSLAGPATPFFPISANDTTASSNVSSTLVSNGRNFAPGIATAQLEANSQIAATSSVIVNGDGVFDLNNFSQTLNAVTINAGAVTTGAGPFGGVLTVGSLTMTDGTLTEPGNGSMVTVTGVLNMTGGTVNLSGLNSELLLQGALSSVTATSDAAGAADITGKGTLSLGSTTRTFTINAGPEPQGSDLDVSAILAGTAAEGLTKTGAGRLEIDNDDGTGVAGASFSGATTVNQGDVQLDGIGSFQKISIVNAIDNSTTIELNYDGANASFTFTGNSVTDLNSLRNALNAVGIPPALVSSVFANYSNPLDVIFSLTFTTLLAAVVPTVTSAAGTGTAFVTLPNNVAGVVLNGGSVSGSGAAGAVSMLSAAAGGTVNPGDNSTPNLPGVLNVNGNVTWNANTIFHVDLNNTSGTHPVPIAGADYDQLAVNGNVNLNGATLLGLTGAGIVAAPVGDEFTILQTVNGVITGNLVGDIGATTGAITNVVFLNGQKFSVNQTATSIVLTRALDTATISLTTTPGNPSIYGQDVTYTATVNPEAGAGNIPVGAQLTFTLDEALFGNLYTQTLTEAVAGQSTMSETFDPENLFSNIWTPLSAHTIDVTFTDPNPVPSYAPAKLTPTLTQTVNQAQVSIGSISANPAAPIYGQAVTITAVVTPTIAQMLGTLKPSGTVSMSVDAGAAIAANITVPATGLVSWTIPVSSFEVGPHTLSFLYNGDPNYAATPAASPVTFSLPVAQDPTSVAVTATVAGATVTASNYGQTVTFTATITPTASGGALPGGTVNFYDGTVVPANLLAGSVPVSGGVATFTTANLSVLTSHTINAVYSGDLNYIGNTPATPASEVFTVNKGLTSTAVIASPPTSVFGQPVSFTATVTPTIAGFGTPSGTVSFYNGAAVPGNLLGTVTLDGTGTAVLSNITNLSMATHTINVTYSGDSKYQTSAGAVVSGFIVGQASTNTAVTATLGSSVFGQAVTFKATVSVQSPGAGLPANGETVTFYDGPTLPANAIGTATLTSGVATLNYSGLSVNAHTINAVYAGDTNFLTSTGTLSSSFVVGQASSHTVVTASPTSTVFGQSVTFTATVSAVSPGVGTPSTTVTFYNGAAIPANQIGTGTLSGGVASFSTNSLAVGNYTITAVYGGDSNFTTSSATVAESVITSGTATTLAAAPTSGDLFGQSVTLTATVTAGAPGAGPVNSGTVNFYYDVAVPLNLLGTSGTVTNGVASISSAALPVSAAHTLIAVYSGTPGFNTSTGTLTNYAVVAAPSTTTVSAAPASGDIFGQAVTLTATVTANSPSTATVSGGTVSFYNGATLLGTSGAVAGGTATLTTSTPTLPVGASLTITAVYSGNTDFAGSTGTLTSYAVGQAGTATTVAANPASGDVFGQAVTFTATVTAQSPSTATVNGGTVSFYDGAPIMANLLGTSAPVSAGTATLTSSSLAVNSGHTITAVYNGNIDFLTSTGTLTGYPVGVTGTNTAVTATPTSGDVFGESVTLTATMTAASPSTATVSGGTVSFYDGAPITANLLGTSGTVGGGSASISTAALSVGTHTITAVYSGDGVSFNTSTGTLASYTLGKANTSTTVSASPTSSDIFGAAVTLTATIGVTGLGSGTPNAGLVSFYDGAASPGNLLGTGPVGGGVATFTTSALSVNTHVITAVYAGDGVDFNGSTGTLNNFIVGQAGTGTSVSASPSAGDVFGQAVTLTATVTATNPSSAIVNGGTVSFYNGAPLPIDLLGTSGAVAGGVASFTTTALPVNASLTITAVYGGNASFTTSTGTLNGYAVSATGTSTAVSASPASGDVFGQSVTFTAAVAALAPSSAAVNGGTVSFYNGSIAPGNLLGISGTVSGGIATFTTTALPLSSGLTINAAYSGNASFSSSTGTLNGYAVTTASTTTAVAASPASGDVFGQSVTFTATVSAAAPSAVAVNGGTVSFYNGAAIAANLLGTSSNVGGGTATFSTTALPTNAALTINAVYSGNASFGSSPGTLASYAVGQAGTTVSFTTNPVNGDVFGEAVTFTATVAPVNPSVLAVSGGTVSFYNGAALPGNFLGASGGVSAGSATFSTSALPVGTHSITAVYSGSVNYLMSSNSLSNYGVSLASTSTSVSTAPSGSQIFGAPVTLTATIVAASPSTAPVSIGTVTFYDGAAVPANSLGVVNVSAGAATLTTSTLPLNTSPGFTFTAVYSGDGVNLIGSTGTLNNYTITQAGTNTTVSANAPSGDIFGQAVTFTANVTAVSPSSAGVSGGTVNFYDGSALPANFLASGTVNGSGTATASTTALSVSAGHTIVAVFTGNADFVTSTGTLNSYAVGATNTVTTVAANPLGSDVFGEPVILTATVNASSPSAASVNSGTVSFYDGAPVAANFLGTSGVVSNGSASITTGALVVNTNLTITAVYSGDGVSFNTSTGTLSNYGVTAANTLTTVSANPANGSAVFGAAVTFTAVVGAVSPSLAVVNGGTVSFYNGAAIPANLLGVSGTVTGGTAGITTAGLALSNGFTITAVYSGDGLDFSTSTGTYSYSVGQAPTSSVVSALPSGSQVFGAAVTLTANLTATGSSATVNGGTVSFYNGAAVPANLLGISATVSGGAASISTSVLPVGATDTITAVYTGAADFLTSSGTLSYGVAQAATTTVIASSSISNTSGAGQAVTFTATVTAASPSSAVVNGGTVQFFDGATPLGAASPVSAGVATLTTTALTQGLHSISAVYNSANIGSFTTSTAPALTQNVLATSTTTVSANPNPAPFGQPVTFTIAVTGTAGVPTGTVTLYDGAVAPANQIALPVGLDGSGRASVTPASNFSVGSHTIIVVYSGAANVYAPSTGSPTSPLVVNAVGTTTALVASPSAAPVFGQAVSLTATVNATTGSAPTTGAVTFTDATTNTVLGTVNLTGSNVATLQTTSLSVATHTITAVYNLAGAGNFAESTGAVSGYAVHQATTSLALASSVPGTSAFGQAVVFSATVAATGSSSVNPTAGTVTFKNGSTIVATVALSGSNVATYTNTTFAVNTSAGYNITASYAANTSYGASSGGTVNQKVAGTSTNTNLVSSQPGGSSFSQSVTFTATITNGAGGANPTTGTVKFMDGATLLKTVALSKTNVAVFTTTTLAVATHSITAVFTSSTTSFAGSSSVVSQVVSPAATVTTLTASSANWAVGQAITFTARVTAPTGGTPTTRTVSFYDGGTFLGNGTYSNGAYTFKTSALGLGAHSITAVYNLAGAGNFASSVSNALNQNVMFGASVTVASSAATVAPGATFTLTASVTGADGVPTGAVSFYDNGVAIASAQDITLDANGKAAIQISYPSAGSHKITIVYSGDGTYNPGTSTALTETVKVGSTGRLV